MKRKAITALDLLVIVSLLSGMLLAVFLPALTGSSYFGEISWSAILLRWCLYAPLCFTTLGLLLILLKWWRWTLVGIFVLVALF